MSDQNAELAKLCQRTSEVERRLTEVERDIRRIREAAEARGVEQARIATQLATMATDVAQMQAAMRQGFDDLRKLVGAVRSDGARASRWMSTLLIGGLFTIAAALVNVAMSGTDDADPSSMDTPTLTP